MKQKCVDCGFEDEEERLRKLPDPFKPFDVIYRCQSCFADFENYIASERKRQSGIEETSSNIHHTESDPHDYPGEPILGIDGGRQGVRRFAEQTKEQVEQNERDLFGGWSFGGRFRP